MTDAAGGIEPGGCRKGDAAGCNFFVGQSRSSQQGVEACPLPFFHQFQPLTDDDAVFPD